MNDEKLENLAKRLGGGAAARLDVDATARKVVERLREQPVRRLVWVQQTWLRIAAALVIVLGGAVAVARVSSDPALRIPPISWRTTSTISRQTSCAMCSPRSMN